jgi:outer membrane protein OmpA-like peptidoglycan-associated protein
MRSSGGRFASWLTRVAVAGGLAWFGGTAAAGAEQPTEAAIIDALTRAETPAPCLAGNDRWVVDTLRRAPTRGLTLGERQQVAAIAETRPRIDLEIHFSFDSAVLSPDDVPTLVTLGRALADPRLRGNAILIAGHTDATGSDEYNQALSERRAATVKRFLVANFALAPEKLLALGFGRQQIKNRTDPLAADNRRVRIVKLVDRGNEEHR